LRFPRTLYPAIFVQSLERATSPYPGARNLRLLRTVTTKRILLFLLLMFFAQRLLGQTDKKTITSWAPSSEKVGFESTAYLPRGAEIRILVVKTGHSRGEVVIYPETPDYQVGPVARWPFVNESQVLVFQISQHPGNRFLIQAGTPNAYLTPGSCTRHGNYDQLTFEKGLVLNVKVQHEF
jgi:hypothetical protein